MPDKVINVVVDSKEDGPVSIPLIATPSLVQAHKRYAESDNQLRMKRIGGHTQLISLHDEDGNQLTSMRTGDFGGSLPATTAHTLNMWAVIIQEE